MVICHFQKKENNTRNLLGLLFFSLKRYRLSVSLSFFFSLILPLPRPSAFPRPKNRKKKWHFPQWSSSKSVPSWLRWCPTDQPIVPVPLLSLSNPIVAFYITSQPHSTRGSCVVTLWFRGFHVSVRLKHTPRNHQGLSFTSKLKEPECQKKLNLSMFVLDFFFFHQ